MVGPNVRPWDHNESIFVGYGEIHAGMGIHTHNEYIQWVYKSRFMDPGGCVLGARMYGHISIRNKKRLRTWNSWDSS